VFVHLHNLYHINSLKSESWKQKHSNFISYL